MTRSAFYDARLAHWTAKGPIGGGEDLDPESQALRDVEAAEAAGKEWDPEEPELPATIIALRDEPFGVQIWEAPSAEAGPGARGRYLGRFDEPRVGLTVVAAYNRERAGELVPKGAQGLALLRLVSEVGVPLGTWDEIVGAAMEKILATERARCERIVWALKQCFGGPDRQHERDVIEQHRLAIEQGTTHEQDLPLISDTGEAEYRPSHLMGIPLAASSEDDPK